MPLIILAVVLEAFGVLFALQGFGLVRWPASSFMIDQSLWIYIGVAMVIAANALLLFALRRRRG